MELKTVLLSNFSEKDYEGIYNSLPESEKKRIAQSGALFRKGSLAARYLLSEITGRNDIIYNEKGKPYFKSGPNFSISHTKDMAAVAVSGKRIGVDIEEIRRYNEKLVRRHFNSQEAEYINCDDVRFTVCWTLKEAILKATGWGMAALDKITLDFNEGRPNCKQLKCNLHTEIKKDYVVSVCEIE